MPDSAAIDPEAYWLDAALLARPGMMDLQADLKIDYKSNIARYPLYQPGERTIRSSFRQAPKRLNVTYPTDVRFLDAGHFALETNVDEIASAILEMNVYA